MQICIHWSGIRSERIYMAALYFCDFQTTEQKLNLFQIEILIVLYSLIFTETEL